MGPLSSLFFSFPYLYLQTPLSRFFPLAEACASPSPHPHSNLSSFFIIPFNYAMWTCICLKEDNILPWRVGPLQGKSNGSILRHLLREWVDGLGGVVPDCDYRWDYGSLWSCDSRRLLVAMQYRVQRRWQPNKLAIVKMRGTIIRRVVACDSF